MSANAGLDYTRWLPSMDTVMMSEEEMRNKAFRLGSLTHRRQVMECFLKKGWWLGYCSRCGDTLETGEIRGVRVRCMICFARSCEICEPGPHECFSDEEGYGLPFRSSLRNSLIYGVPRDRGIDCAVH